MKILKSFNTAHEAVQWMNANHIEDTYIDTTPVLKSVGYRGSNLSNGNYHIVLKADGESAPISGKRKRLAPEGESGLSQRQQDMVKMTSPYAVSGQEEATDRLGGEVPSEEARAAEEAARDAGYDPAGGYTVENGRVNLSGRVVPTEGLGARDIEEKGAYADRLTALDALRQLGLAGRDASGSTKFLKRQAAGARGNYNPDTVDKEGISFVRSIVKSIVEEEVNKAILKSIVEEEVLKAIKNLE
jgi:hypothetical protein